MTFQRERKRSKREVSPVSLHFETALILYPGSEAAEPRSFSFIHLESACQAYGLFSQAVRHSERQYPGKGHVDRYGLVGSMHWTSKAAGSTKSRLANDQEEGAAVEEGGVSEILLKRMPPELA